MNDRDMMVQVEYQPDGSFILTLNVEGVSWSGEVARDMVSRVLDGMERAIAIAWAVDDLEDADDDDAEP